MSAAREALPAFFETASLEVAMQVFGLMAELAKDSASLLRGN